MRNDVVKETLGNRKRELAKKQAENDLLKRQMSSMEQKILALAESLQMGQEALQFLEDLANSRRGNMKGKIEKVITEALQLIYGPSYALELLRWSGILRLVRLRGTWKALEAGYRTQLACL